MKHYMYLTEVLREKNLLALGFEPATFRSTLFQNLKYSSLKFSGILDQDAPDYILASKPELYAQGRLGQVMTNNEREPG